jgi:hypothetical protein
MPVAKRRCLTPKCMRKATVKGRCNRCYQRAVRSGEITPKPHK